MANLIDPLKASSTAPPLLFHHHGPDHWSRKVFGDPLKDDIRVLLTLVWRRMLGVDPSPLQLDIAWQLQKHGWSSEIDHMILMAFRGAAKSWITCVYVLFNLNRVPTLKIGVVSGSGRRAVDFVVMALSLIGPEGLPELQHLCPLHGQRQSSTSFDVGPIGLVLPQTPSVWARGITSQLPGLRADIIVGDDVETNTNSMTQEMRDKIREAVKEFDSIIVPGGQILFLGTPQSASSIYATLMDAGYKIMIYPARFPNGPQRRAYGDRLAKYISFKLDKNPSLMGTSTEPRRFSDADLMSREIAVGQATFALQFMLDTSLSDVEKYPLKLKDIICMSLDLRRGPESVSWGAGDHLVLRDVQPIALPGDLLHGPASVSDHTVPYEQTFGYIDPSGSGGDETTLTVGSVLYSTPFALAQRAYRDGFGEETLKDIAKWCVFYKVQLLRVEEEFGQGMFAQLLRPYVKKAWEDYRKAVQRGEGPSGAPAREGHYGTEIVSERSMKVQKEHRILEVLEPLFRAHRLVISKELLQEDYLSARRAGDGTEYASHYTLMHQITNLTREKGCLSRDDRVEGLAGLMNMMRDNLGLSPLEGAMRDKVGAYEEMLKLLEQEHDDMRNEGGQHRGGLRQFLRSGRERH